MLNNLTVKQYLAIKIHLLHEILKKENRKSLIIGISGGIDSVVTLGILKELDKTYPNTYTIIPMLCPINNSKGTTEQKEAWDLGYEAIDHFGYSENTYDLSDLSKATAEELDIETPYVQQQMDYWLRPMAFYKMAMTHSNSIIVSTTNFSEWSLGWFSQYLDIFGIHPIIDLYKSEVYLLAKYFNVPDSIIKTPPKGGLADSATDEEALGFSYYQFESYHKDKSGSFDLIEKITTRIKESEFKRRRFNAEWIFQLKPRADVGVPCPCCSYRIEGATHNCTNCGGQTQFGRATGYTYINTQGLPCTHEFHSQVMSRNYTAYRCKYCIFNFFIDSGD